MRTEWMRALVNRFEEVVRFSGLPYVERKAMSQVDRSLNDILSSICRIVVILLLPSNRCFHLVIPTFSHLHNIIISHPICLLSLFSYR
jgi:hypothetical protein